MEIVVTSNCDLTYNVLIGEVTQILTYAQMCDLHSAIEACLEWDKPHVQPDTEKFIQELNEMLEAK